MNFLVIDDNKIFRDATCLMIDGTGNYAEGADCGEVALASLRAGEFNAVLLDLHLREENGLDLLEQILKDQPRLPVVMFTAQGNVKTAVDAMRRGAMDFLEKPFTREQFHLVLARVQRFHQLSQNIERLEQEVQESKAQSVDPILEFTTPAMREVMDVLLRAAKTSASILICGENGTGKSIAARAVHQQSPLSDKPFVTVSCASLSKELLESALFGHAKGSFTGAVKDLWGKVKAAAGGTLFLDEIGDLPMDIQPKLLRLLQEREYERVGENITRHADMRVIAATNRDLKKSLAEGAFREDLYFRLNVITVVMPPLRERQDDLLRFAEHYLKYFAAQCGRRLKGFSKEAMACIAAYPWPGNLRELRNAIERAVILARGNELVAEDLPAELRGLPTAGTIASDGQQQIGSAITMQKIEELHLRKVLERTPGMTEASEILGIDRATLYRMRKRFGMD